jgi:hypothetical protein
MSEFANQGGVLASGSEPMRARRKSIEDVSKDCADGADKRPSKSGGDVELPPNENLKKDADEAYGDTEIPERKNDV